MKDRMMDKEETDKMIIKGKGIGIDKIVYKKPVKDPLNRDINKNHKTKIEIVHKNSQSTRTINKQTITVHKKTKSTNVHLASVPVLNKSNKNPRANYINKW